MHFQIDLLYVQSMKGLAEIEESGITEDSFHEVRLYLCSPG